MTMRTHLPDELADWERPINHISPYVLRVDADGRALRIPAGYPGAGALVQHDYLTPREIEIVRSASRRQKSERRPHYTEATE